MLLGRISIGSEPMPWTGLRYGYTDSRPPTRTHVGERRFRSTICCLSAHTCRARISWPRLEPYGRTSHPESQSDRVRQLQYQTLPEPFLTHGKA